jgi:ribosomal protein S18 acetylase RimI-like enzyme
MEPTIRPARSSDYPAFARLHPELASGDPVPSAERFAKEIAPACLVIEHGSEVVGYGYYQSLIDSGYVRHVVIAPEARGRGSGGLLMLAIAERLRRAGCERWRLNVKPDNEPALKLYHGLGLRELYSSVALRFDWERVASLPEASVRVHAGPIEPGQDPLVEGSFRLARGQLASARAAGRVLAQLTNTGGAPLAAAVFDPSFPGAFPFKVRDPSLARPLLEALRRHARADLAHVQVVAEDDPALARLLIGVGAEVRLEVVHLEGPIPGES